jgi:hypothetical protein
MIQLRYTHKQLSAMPSNNLSELFINNVETKHNKHNVRMLHCVFKILIGYLISHAIFIVIVIFYPSSELISQHRKSGLFWKRYFQLI